MTYTKIQNFILLGDTTLSESVVYSTLLELDGVDQTKEEKLIALIARCEHAITRVTINTAIRSLIAEHYIDKNLNVRRTPTTLATPSKIRTKAGRPKQILK